MKKEKMIMASQPKIKIIYHQGLMLIGVTVKSHNNYIMTECLMMSPTNEGIKFSPFAYKLTDGKINIPGNVIHSNASKHAIEQYMSAIYQMNEDTNKTESEEETVDSDDTVSIEDVVNFEEIKDV